MTDIKITMFFLLCSTVAFAQENSDSDSVTRKDEVRFSPVEKSAEYPGGMPKFYQYLNKNLKYPRGAKRAGISGRVYIEFIINRDGSIDDESVRPVSSEEVDKFGGTRSNIILDKECELEAIRLIKECPNWNPGLQKDKPVRQKMVVPVLFKI